MDIGTDVKILGKAGKFREPSNGAGRPKVNRELIIRNLKLKDETGRPRYTYEQIAKIAKCSTKTIKRVVNEARKSGDLIDDERDGEAIGIIEADFDSECKRAMGYSFLDWVSNQFKNPNQGKYHFNYASKCWESIWGKCSILDLSDRTSKVGDLMAMEFIKTFGEDTKRMRNRLKMIRFFFRFIGRQDLCDRHFKMTNTRHPRSKRTIPEITMLDFPAKFETCVEEMVKEYGPIAKLALRLKVVGQFRTGDRTQQRELMGIHKGTETKTYLLMNSPDEYRFHVLAKRAEEWDIIWMPRAVREDLWTHYQTINTKEIVFPFKIKNFRTSWSRITKRIIGRPLILHDLRKVSITWLYVMGVPLEIATMLNVGWRDLSTARDHYLDIRKVLRSSYRKEYRDMIPAWYKDGLDEFVSDNKIIRTEGPSPLDAIQGTGNYRG